jgi:hypothetical protein
MSVNMDIPKGALEELLGRFETATYVGAFDARSDGLQVVRQ